MKFAHLGDCHLGSWRQPELKELNLKSFQYAIDKCIREKVDFILISGDLFDSAYPPIDILKDTFHEFKKLKEANIPVFLIAGSHDYSVSGKTFLDVLEKAGFCKNVAVFEEKNNKIVLEPTIYKNIAIYGYPGKKSSLEVEELSRISLQDSPLFKILLLHTSIKDAVSSLPIEAVNQDALPKVDYVALSHLHIKYQKGKFVYSGPIFPNNISELEELGAGSFCIVNFWQIKREEIKLHDVITFNIEIKNALTATEEIIKNLEKENLKNKIVILKLYGVLEKGKSTDIDFQKIEDYVKKQQAYSFLKSTSKLHLPEPEIKIDITDSSNMELAIIKKFEEKNPNKYNFLIPTLLKTLQMEKLDDEKSLIFEERLISEIKKIIGL
ncbi:MAG: DNA repair exonuclease [Candidatus Pacearchaeota archaeon]|nr:DNA repair exonuclease [Candidatus Pacearchaeota archaeon]